MACINKITNKEMTATVCGRGKYIWFSLEFCVEVLNQIQKMQNEQNGFTGVNVFGLI